MSADAVRLFLQRDALSDSPQYQTCRIEPSFFIIPWTPLAASAREQSSLAQIGQDADFLGCRIVMSILDSTSTTVEATNVPFLMQLRNGSTNTDLTDTETPIQSLADDPNNSFFGLSWSFPILLRRTNQIIGKLTNPNATAYNVYGTVHGVKLFAPAPANPQGNLSA